MSLSSSSTLANAQDQLKDNLNWPGDKTKALAAREAIVWLLAFRGRSQGEGDRRIEFDTEWLRTELERLDAFVGATKSSTQSVTFTAGRPLYG